MTQTLPKPATTPVTASPSPSPGKGAKPTASGSPTPELKRAETDGDVAATLALQKVESTITEGGQPCETGDAGSNRSTPREDAEGEMSGTGTFGQLGGQTLDMSEIK